jgi:signal transduction histidine kinase
MHCERIAMQSTQTNPPEHESAVTTTAAPTKEMLVLLVADSDEGATSTFQCIADLERRRPISLLRASQIDQAAEILRVQPVDVVLCDVPTDELAFQWLDLLRRATEEAVIVAVVAGQASRTFQRQLQLHGVDDCLGRNDLNARSLERMVRHAQERRAFQSELGSSFRREQLRSRILARIIDNAPLQEILADISQAMRTELNCADCGFAIDLADDDDEAILWPSGRAPAAQLANEALTHAKLNPGVPAPDPRCVACVRSIRCGGRLLGELALLPDPTAATQDVLQGYAAMATELIALAIERMQASETLRQSKEELRVLSEQLMSIQESERRRIACDLHDVIGQSLSIVKVSIEEAQQQFVSNGAHEVAAVLATLVPWVKQALGEVRRISMDLRPATIDDLGILPTLSWFFREFSAACPRIVVEQRISVTEGDIPEPIKIVVFRILQEAISNIVKHAQATRIQVVLQRVSDSIELVVIDNGMGFHISAAQEGGKRSIGLSSMRERARGSGADYMLESWPGRGTTVRVTWRLKR